MEDPSKTEPNLFHYGKLETTYRVEWLSENAAGMLKNKDVWSGLVPSESRMFNRWKSLSEPFFPPPINIKEKGRHTCCIRHLCTLSFF